jgi:ABC-type antimicrobial peptide transport system permease subunit
VLAAVGLYGIVSYAVSRRTREFGIRLALRKAASVCHAGVGWLIGAHDPWALAGAALAIVIVGLFAGLAPALRAMRIQPVLALRYE